VKRARKLVALSPSNEETDGFEKSSRKNHEHFLFDPKPEVGSDLRAAKIVEEESHAKVRRREGGKRKTLYGFSEYHRHSYPKTRIRMIA